MNNRVLDYVEKMIKTLETKENYFESDVNKIEEQAEKLLILDSNISAEDTIRIKEKISSLKENAKLDSEKINVVSPKSFKVAKVAVASMAVVGTLTVGGVILSGCGPKKEVQVEQPIDMESLKAEIRADLLDEMQQQSNEIEEPTKILSESLSFDPNDNDELVSRMTDFIASAWAAGIDVPVDKMMDYYMIMNLEDIDPIDYARLGYKTKTTESILSNYQYCANLFMDDLLTIEAGKTVDYSLIVAHKDSALSLNTLEQKIVDMNEKVITSKDVHDYIYDTYISIEGQREVEYNAGPNWQAYSMMFSYDELTNGKGLSADENDILNEDRNVMCTNNQTVEGDKNKSDKAQEQTSIVNQLEEKLKYACAAYDQDLTNISDSEKRTGVELENEIMVLLKERNAVLIENPKFVSNYGINSSSSKSTNGSVNSSGSAGGESTSVIKQKLSPEEESTIQSNYAGSTTYTDANGQPTSDIDKTKQEAVKKAQDDAEAEAKKNAGATKTEFVPINPEVKEQTESIDEHDYIPVDNSSKPDNSVQPNNNENNNQHDDSNVVETTEEIEEYDFLEETNLSNVDLINELNAYKEQLLNMSLENEEEQVKTM